MLIVCPTCATSYSVQPNTVPPHGCQVRCLRCRTVWYAQLDQINKLLAAAAAIAADCGIRREANTLEEVAKQAEPSGDVEAPASHSEPPIVAEMGAANAVVDCAAVAEATAENPQSDSLVVVQDAAADQEGAAASQEPARFFVVAHEAAPDPESDHFLGAIEAAPVNPGADSCSVAEIAIVDTEEDHLAVVTDSATANSLPEFPMVAEVVTLDAQSDHTATCEHFAGPDLNVAPMPFLPPNEQLETSVSETTPSDQAVDMVADGNRLPDNLFGEVTADENTTGRAVEAHEQVPPTYDGFSAVMGEETGSAALRFGPQDCSDDFNVSAEREAVSSKQVDPSADKQPIDLRADYSENRFSVNAKNIELRAVSHSRHKTKVRSRSWNVSARRLVPRWPLSNLHTGILALALLDIFLVGWRTDIVQKLPQTASFYALAGLPVNLRGLAFDSITTSTLRDDGTPILVVEGNIINDTQKNVRVPQIRFVVRDAAAQEIYSWTANAARTSLLPGQAVAFHTRLASPPPTAHDVVLRFVNRRDAVTVIR